MISKGNSELHIYLWDNDDGNLYLATFVKEKSMTISINGTIVSAIPGDYDYNGSLDVLLTWDQSDKRYFSIYLQLDDRFKENKRVEIPKSSQPAVMDLNSDLELDMILNLQDENGKLAPYVMLKDDEDSDYNKKTLKSLAYASVKGCLTPDQIPLTSPHSAAYVDLNKDCLADIFTTHQNEAGDTLFQIWLNVNNGLYCLVVDDVAPNGTGQVSFADVDRNGSEDIIFPVCVGEDCEDLQEIHIIFNDNKVSSTCNFDKDSFESFKLYDIAETKSTNHKLVLPIHKSSRFYSKSVNYPFTVRMGDFNSDSYPDMLLNLYEPNKENSSYITIYYNKDCNSDKCGDAADFRYFEENDDGEFDKLRDTKGAFAASFFDLDENGILDIVVNYSFEGQSRIRAFYNNFMIDAFHLKTYCLNGSGKQEYSTNLPGAVVMFKLTELDMTPVQMHATQMPQTAYFALQTPYVVHGLGRTNSYIEDLYFAVPRTKDFSRVWSPIIPNSYLIVSPNKDTDSDWFLEPFASPSEMIAVIIGVSVGCLVIIGTFVIWRYKKEKDEDRNKRRLNLQ